MNNSKIIKSFLREKIKYYEYYNNMAPFPIFSTEMVLDYKNKLNEIIMNKKENYDEEPVVACKFCKSLHIISDELENDVCFKCGSVNQLVEFKDIHEYKKFLKEKDE